MTVSRWEQGRAVVEALIQSEHLQQVRPNRDRADALLMQARRHLESAEQLLGGPPDRVRKPPDLEGSAALLYDAARKALAAILANQGLRATSRGGHLAVHQAVEAQLVPPLGTTLRSFDRLRRQRNRTEYSSDDQQVSPPNADDLTDDIAKSRTIVEACAAVLDSMPVY